MKDTKRALRRHHRQRMIARTLRLSRLWGLREEDRLQTALRLYNNRQICSCALCNNPRKWCGPTIQERRQSFAWKQEIDDMALLSEEMSDVHSGNA